MPKGCIAVFNFAGELAVAPTLGPTDILQFTETVSARIRIGKGQRKYVKDQEKARFLTLVITVQDNS